MQQLPPLDGGRGAGLQSSTTPPWQPGQHLLARVVRGAGANGHAVIRIGRTELLAATHLPLVRGERLAIEVSRIQPQISLHVTAVQQASGETQAASDASALTRATLQHLAPRQNALGPLLATLLDAHEQAGDGTLRTAISKLVDNLPSVDDIKDPVKLKRAIAQAAGDQPVQAKAPPPALRTLLLDLLRATSQTAGEANPPEAAASPPAPPPPGGDALSPQAQAAALTLASTDTRAVAAQLRDLVDGALARGALHQLSANLQSSAHEPVLCAELPVRNGNAVDIVPFRIRREPPRRDNQRHAGGAAPWKVSLALDLPGIGPLHARLTLSGNDVSARFWATDQRVRRTVDSALPTLANALTRCGLNAAHLSCQTGKPPANRPPPGLVDEPHLLDTRV